MHHHQFFIGVLVSSSLLFLSACAPVETLRIPDPIGPQPVGYSPTGLEVEDGFLVVYTDTDTVELGTENIPYRPHKGYDLSDLRGGLLQRIKNRTSVEDENPEHVELPSGHYMITGAGLGQQVEVKVKVEREQTTFVYLDRSWRPPKGAHPKALVKAPDGTPLGWHARARAVLGIEEELLYEGSSTIATFVRDAQDVYKGVSQGGISAGEVAVLATAEIGGVARKVSQPPQGVECTTIGYDAIVTIVRADLPIEGLTMQQLKEIFSGQVTNWNQVGGPKRTIIPLIAGHGSGVRSVFRDIVLKGAKYDDNALTVSPDRDILDRVARSGRMIGQISMGFLHDDERVRVLTVDGQDPSPDNPNYPITRPLNLCLKTDGPQDARDFLNWALGNEGQEVLKRRFVGNESERRV
jgi:phosphate transport system substrate-binding protein